MAKGVVIHSGARHFSANADTLAKIGLIQQVQRFFPQDVQIQRRVVFSGVRGVLSKCNIYPFLLINRNCSAPPYFALSTRHRLHKDADCSAKYGSYSRNMQKRALKGANTTGVLNSYDQSLNKHFPFCFRRE